jgi:NADPH:quinone reductase-like Zn-dependent oxidoreductase
MLGCAGHRCRRPSGSGRGTAGAWRGRNDRRHRQCRGRFALILESAGGASLQQAIQLVEPNGTVVVFGNAAADSPTIGFSGFRGAPNARLQSFSDAWSEAGERFAPDLALLVSLVAGGALKPQIGVERDWRGRRRGGAVARPPRGR